MNEQERKDKNEYERFVYHNFPEARARKLMRSHLYYLRNKERKIQQSMARYWAQKQHDK